MGKDKHESSNAERKPTLTLVEKAVSNMGDNIAMKPHALSEEGKAELASVTDAGNIRKNVGPIRIINAIGRGIIDGWPTDMATKIDMEGSTQPVSYSRVLVRLTWPDDWRKLQELRSSRQPKTTDTALERDIGKLESLETRRADVLKECRGIQAKWKALDLAGYQVTVHSEADDEAEPFHIIDIAKVGMPITCGVTTFLKLNVEPNKHARDLISKQSRKAKPKGTASAAGTTVTVTETGAMAFDPLTIIKRNTGNLIATIEALGTLLETDEYKKAEALRTNPDVVAACRRAIIGIGVVLGEKPDAMEMFYAADDGDADKTEHQQSATQQ